MSLLDNHHVVIANVVREICRQPLGDHLWRLYCHDIGCNREHNPLKHSVENLSKFLLFASRTSASSENLERMGSDRETKYRKVSSDVKYPNVKRFCTSSNIVDGA